MAICVKSERPKSESSPGRCGSIASATTTTTSPLRLIATHEREGPLPSANCAPSGGSERCLCLCRERGGSSYVARAEQAARPHDQHQHHQEVGDDRGSGGEL